MRCVKTGFHAYIGGHRGWIYGDAFMNSDGTLILRVCRIEREPMSDVKHYSLENWDIWFDERQTSQKNNSTLVASVGHYVDHGYDGVAI